MLLALALSLLAGAMIPLGGLLARVETLQPGWLQDELRHSVVAFGGGALLAAVALVLIPQGSEALSPALAIGCFVGGAVLFALLDRGLARMGGSHGQLLAMLADFLPEAVALGALFAAGSGAAPLMALLIALQNLPEGFNAFREAGPGSPGEARRTLALFAGLALLGPAATLAGHAVLVDFPVALGCLMVTAAGGILYLVFQDIAPQVRLERAWGPPFGAVAGFGLGYFGHLVIH